MKFCGLFIISSTLLLVRNAEGRLSIEVLFRLLSPRNPQLHLIRRIEDANGDPYAVLDTAGLVMQYGYPAEQHNFTDKDGYNIAIFRVPGSAKSPPRKGKPIAFLQHGMLASSDCFLLLPPKEGIVFILADAGYDVWLGNIRGNTYGRSHNKLSVDDKEFWEFSWHEMALVDVAGGIDYALDYCGQDAVYYIGHSMGSTMAFVLLSENPAFNAKMHVVVALAPSGYWEVNPSIGMKMIVDFAPMIKELADSAKIYNILPQNKFYTMMFEALCGKRSSMTELCIAGAEMSLPLFSGTPADGFNPREMLHLVKHFPCGVSTQTLMHYAQCIRSGVFKQYDFGVTENLKKYGTEVPPAYDVSKISAPMALIYGNTDLLALPQNTIVFSKRLPNLVTCEAVPPKNFNHFDFLVALNVKELLYDRILDIFSKY